MYVRVLCRNVFMRKDIPKCSKKVLIQSLTYRILVLNFKSDLKIIYFLSKKLD